jgi:hypothetical protein
MASERSNITIEEFFNKLMSGEYYVNPEARDNPRQSAILENLEKWSSPTQAKGHVNISNIQTSSVGEITTIYNDTINTIKEDKSIPEEKKSKVRRYLSFFKEKHIHYIPLAVELIKRYLWPT